MNSPSPLVHHPALLPPGTVVGSWRVEAWAGCGVYGAVYRAVSLRHPLAAPVALKLALHPSDPRFTREAELLSRCKDPSIPRLLDQGSWRDALGELHPFLVMQWVDGVSLYDQARLHPPAPSQTRRWLAQLAQALDALHSQGALHRDLKGDNIRVRRSDGRAMLLDFGTGLYPGAAPLTPPMGFPGTSLYRSPESWLFEVRFHTSSTARYVATPADDLYALGVTACRLLTGEYPLLPEPFRDAHGHWHLRSAHHPPALLRSPSIEPSLRAFTLRLLSVQPEQRGTAAQLAQELEQTLKPFQRVRTWHAAPWGALAAASMAVAVWAWKAASDNPAQARSLTKADSADTGTAGLGDTAPPPAPEPAPSASIREAMSENTLPQPIPGQMQPDEKGHCASKGLVSLNGACWLETSDAPETCLTLGGQMFKGSCYVPFIPPGRRTPSTSSPVQKP